MIRRNTKGFTGTIVLVAIAMGLSGCARVLGKEEDKQYVAITDSLKEQESIDSTEENEGSKNINDSNNGEEIKLSKEEIISGLVEKYGDKVPNQWGENVTGVVNTIKSEEKVLFLTFDACGGLGGKGYDKELIDFLIEDNVEANLFINNRWINDNRDLFVELASNELFAIESHGYEHRPLSINGKEVYGINGTKSIENVYEELTVNDEIIEEITGEKPKFFRSGTAYYDEVSVEIASDLGKIIAGFNVLGDGGATFSKKQIINQFNNAKSGDIVILHMNQPQSDVYEAMKEVIPMLKSKGYCFRKLRDFV